MADKTPHPRPLPSPRGVTEAFANLSAQSRALMQEFFATHSAHDLKSMDPLGILAAFASFAEGLAREISPRRLYQSAVPIRQALVESRRESGRRKSGATLARGRGKCGACRCTVPAGPSLHRHGRARIPTHRVSLVQTRSRRRPSTCGLQPRSVSSQGEGCERRPRSGVSVVPARGCGGIRQCNEGARKTREKTRSRRARAGARFRHPAHGVTPVQTG